MIYYMKMINYKCQLNKDLLGRQTLCKWFNHGTRREAEYQTEGNGDWQSGKGFPADRQ